MSNNNMLLKKSFKVRQLLDIFLNSKFFILVHLEEYSNNNFENFRREMLENKVNLKLINKDDFFLLNLQRLGQGPTVLFFSEEFFFDKFFSILDKNKINKQIVILLKYEQAYLTYAGYLQFKEKFSLSKSNIGISLLNSLNFHFYFLKFINKTIKNNFLQINFIYKFYMNKVMLLLNLIKSKKNGNI